MRIPPAPDAWRVALERESDVEFFTAGGPGGQHRNKTASGVRVRHLPTGVVASATERRSQWQNRAAAFERLREKLAVFLAVQAERVPTRPSRASRKRRLEAKRMRAKKKLMRKGVRREE